MIKSIKQSLRLVAFGFKVLFRNKTLGTGLREQCWSGLALETTKSKGVSISDYYGLKYSHLRETHSKNKRIKPGVRNFVMCLESFKLAFSVPYE